MTAASRTCYLLLVIVSVAFVATVMAFTLVPWELVPNWLKENLLFVVLAEVGAIILLGLLSMAWDNPPTTPVLSAPPEENEKSVPTEHAHEDAVEARQV